MTTKQIKNAAQKSAVAQKPELEKLFAEAVAGTKNILVFGSELVRLEQELQQDWHRESAFREWLEIEHPNISPAVALMFYRRAAALYGDMGLAKSADVAGLLLAPRESLKGAAREVRANLEDLMAGRGAGQMVFELGFGVREVKPESEEKKKEESGRNAARKDLAWQIHELAKKPMPESPEQDKVLKLAFIVMAIAYRRKDIAFQIAQSESVGMDQLLSAAVSLALELIPKMDEEAAMLVQDRMMEVFGLEG